MPTTNPAVTKITPNIAKHPTITEGGTRGFLLWMKTDPIMRQVYARLKPELAQLIASPVGLSGMGAASGSFGFASASFGQTGTTGSAGIMSDLSSSISSVASSVGDSVTQAASTAPASSSWINDLSSIVTAATGAFTTADQLVTAQKVTNAQLAQAAAGKPPLNLSSYGLSTSPGLNFGLSSGTSTTLLIAVGIIGAVILLPRMLKR